jgi:hypothetical protein
VHRLLEQLPEVANNLVQQGLQPLQHLYERRLNRRLTDAERVILRQRLTTLGADRLGDVVLDLDSVTLAAWLADERRGDVSSQKHGRTCAVASLAAGPGERG